MKLVLIIFLALATTAAFSPFNNKVRLNRLTVLELKDDDTEKWIFNKTRISIQGRAGILSANGKRMVENFVNHLPCGWPEMGIPPLAPYAKKEIDFNIRNAFIELSQKFEYFRIDGLDILLIERLKVGYLLSKFVKFNLTFPKIIISGKYFTDIFIDSMKENGVSVKLNAKGDFELMLETLNFQGSFRYDMPLLLGHTKIYKLDISMSMGKIVSQIGGIVGDDKLNRLLNDKIEEITLHTVKSKQNEINKKLEDVLVPFINEKLEGHNMWKFFKSLFGQKGKICYPPPYPW